MKIDTQLVESFKVAKVFRRNTDKINSIDFSPSGETLVSSEDDQIVIYDCVEGAQISTVNSMKYGAGLIRFTNTKNTAIHTSTKVDNAIRYLSLHDKKYISYFSGHASKVVTLCPSPADDSFLSGSLDHTLRLWDLRSSQFQGLMHIPSGWPVAAYDPFGLIFAVGINSQCIRLYDLRNYGKGPFNTFDMDQEICDWTGLKFTHDGKKVLIATNRSKIYLIDAFLGNELNRFTGHVNKDDPIEASLCPDSQFVFSGAADGCIHVWSADTGDKVKVWSADPLPVQCVQFNPKMMMFASASYSVSFWLPSGGNDLM